VKFLNIASLLLVVSLATEWNPDLQEIYSEIKSWYKINEKDPITFYHSNQNKLDTGVSILQIILIRHAQPRINTNGWFSYNAARNFIYAYDTVSVVDFHLPPLKLMPNEHAKIFCSTLNRAFDTARKIFDDTAIIETDSVFIEFQREIVPLPLIRMPIKGWTGLSRFFWIIGLHSSEIPGFKSEKSRAGSDARMLEKAARENKKVILVAHGFLNKYILKYLKRNGWDHSYNGGNDYLAVQVLTKIVYI
jgi:broad specificity phosphatase PhoE